MKKAQPTCHVLQHTNTRRGCTKTCHHPPEATLSLIRNSIEISNAARLLLNVILSLSRGFAARACEGTYPCAAHQRLRSRLRPRPHRCTSAAQNTRSRSILPGGTVSTRAERLPHRTSHNCAAPACARWPRYDPAWKPA